MMTFARVLFFIAAGFFLYAANQLGARVSALEVAVAELARIVVAEQPR